MSSVAERLNAYYPFDASIIDEVSAAAERFHDASFQEVVSVLDIPEPFVYASPNGGNVSFVDIKPKGGYRDVIVYHDAIISPANENMTMHVALLSAIRPDSRIIAAGTPGGIGNGAGKLKGWDLERVWGGDLRPMVGPTLTYLASNEIEEAVHVGYSFGADKVLAAATHANKYDHCVSKFISMDTAAIEDLGRFIRLPRIGGRFISTNKHVKPYIKASDSAAFEEARKLSKVDTQAVGLLRLTSLACAHALSLGGYEDRVTEAMEQNPDLQGRIMWGSNEELGKDKLMTEATDFLKVYFGKRVQTTRLVGQYHAMCEDINLHTATIQHGIIN